MLAGRNALPFLFELDFAGLGIGAFFAAFLFYDIVDGLAFFFGRWGRSFLGWRLFSYEKDRPYNVYQPKACAKKYQ